MKTTKLRYSLALVFALSACATQNSGTSADAGNSVGTAASAAGASSNTANAATNVTKAVAVTDAELKTYSAKAVAELDKENNVAPAKNKYAVRLAKITKGLTGEDGLALNYQVYLVKDVNAFAMPDGSVRVFAGLMDMLTDNELRAVIGHEIGHVKLGHALTKMRTSYAAAAGVNLYGQGGIATAALAQLGKRFLNAQLSQSLEFDADDYAVEFMKRHKYPAVALATGLQKIAKLESTEAGAQNGLFASHPDTAQRVTRAKENTAKKSVKKG